MSGVLAGGAFRRDRTRVADQVTSEPGVAEGAAAGFRTPFSPMAQALPSTPLFVYVTTKAYLAQHRDVVEEFAADMVKANDYAAQNSPFVRSYGATAFHPTTAEAAKMTLPQ